MDVPIVLAVTWIAQPHRVFGLDWSYLTLLGLVGNLTFSTRFFVLLAAERALGRALRIF